MIKKSRIRFIITTMIIVLIIFSFFFVGNIKITKSSQNKIFESQLDEIITRQNDFHQANTPSQQDCVLIINGETISNNINDDKVLEIYNSVKDIINLKEVFGHNGNYYYKLFNNQSSSIFVLKDMSKDVAIYRESNLKILNTLLFIYLVIFIIVYLISYKIFEPIKKMLDEQKRFISDASHELKTPITIISANTSVLSEERNSEWLDNIKVQTKRLESLINDMLNLSKFDEKRIILSKEDFSLSDLAVETILPFDAVAFENEKKINLNIAKDIVINGDINSAKKIITILIDNAIKYSLKFSEIEVKLEKNKNNIKLSVKNAGSSIKEEDSNKVFERFYRGANSRNRESGGSGLGLSIAKSIADANKWKLTAESHFGISMEISLIIKS